MIVIETCPKCGHDIVNSYVAALPPIPMKYCTVCDWYWTGEPEEVVKVPFGGNSSDYLTETNLYDVAIDNKYVNEVNDNG